MCGVFALLARLQQIQTVMSPIQQQRAIHPFRLSACSVPITARPYTESSCSSVSWRSSKQAVNYIANHQLKHIPSNTVVIMTSAVASVSLQTPVHDWSGCSRVELDRFVVDTSQQCSMLVDVHLQQPPAVAIHRNLP